MASSGEECLLANRGRRGIMDRDDDGDAVDMTPATPRKLPQSIKYIVGNEFCERLSFYGLRAILALFLLEHLRLSQGSATEAVHLFIMASYAAPLLGAFISDSYLGKYRTIMYFSLAYCTGNWVLAWSAAAGGKGASEEKGVPIHARVLAMVGLGLVALGTGGIKPCVSAFGGDQIELSCPPGNDRERLLRLFFPIFYFSINMGSCIAMIVTPLVRHYVSYEAAFMIPAVLMMVALLLFWAGHKDYKHVPPTGQNIGVSVARVILSALFRRRQQRQHGNGFAPLPSKDSQEHEQRSPRRAPSSAIAPIAVKRTVGNLGENDPESNRAPHWLDYAKAEHGESTVEDVKALLRVLMLFLPAPIFWSLFDQQASRWTFQAQRMDGRFPGLPSFHIMPDQMQVLNAIFILVFIPLFNNVVYPIVEYFEFSLRPIRRMVAGMAMCGIAFIISAILETQIERRANAHPATKIPILWQVPQYVAITAGEILFSITGLELAYTQAPASMTAVVQSAWLLTDAAGNLVTVLIVGTLSPSMSRPTEYLFFAGGCFLAACALQIVGRRFTYMSSVEKSFDEDEDPVAPNEQ